MNNGFVDLDFSAKPGGSVAEMQSRVSSSTGNQKRRDAVVGLATMATVAVPAKR